MKTSWKNYSIVLLICIPLLFINIKSSHDWGDDFAQYIYQAKNITLGISQMEIGYIYNPQFAELGPLCKPAGFPLLLAPVYAVFGNSIVHFNIYTSLFLIALALLMFHFFSKQYSALISALLVIVFIYNPWTLNFKMEIMSDIPFTLLLLLCALRYQKEKSFTFLQSLALALLVGFLISVRSIGLVFILAIILDRLRQLYKSRSEIIQKKYNYKILISPAIIAIGGFLINLLINRFIFPTVNAGVSSYSYTNNAVQPGNYILYNIQCNMAVFRSFFEPWNDQWQFVALFSGTMIFAFVVLGMIKKMTERFDFIDGLVIIYLITIIAYPFFNAGFRFLFPLIPYFLYYAVQGIRGINIKLNVKPTVMAIAMVVFILFSYQKGLSEIYKWRKSVLNGPQDVGGSEVFNYIIHATPKTARINFIKPRALALYTERNAMSTRPLQTLSEISKSMVDNNIQYILINTGISDDSLKLYVKLHNKELNLVYSNSTYDFYHFVNDTTNTAKDERITFEAKNGFNQTTASNPWVFDAKTIRKDSLTTNTFVVLDPSQEWGPGFHVQLNEIIKKENAQIVASIEVKPTIQTKNGIFVLSLTKGDSTIQWQGSDLTKFSVKGREWQTLYTSLNVMDVLKPEQDLSSYKLSIYFWNNEKQQVFIDDLHIKVLE